MVRGVFGTAGNLWTGLWTDFRLIFTPEAARPQNERFMYASAII
jgi:hypothetical protein